MSNWPDQFFQSSPQKLSRLVSSTESIEGQWQANEMAAVLRHQLDARILPFRTTSDEARHARESGRERLTFIDLFLQPNPSLELLVQAKDFAKGNREHPASPLAPEICTVLYYASIVAALSRRQTRITNLTDAELFHGIRWCLDQPWLDSRLHNMLEESVSALAAEKG